MRWSLMRGRVGSRGVGPVPEGAVRFDGVGKRFGGRSALRDCTFEVPRGRVAALVGPNGAGKTTLLMVATGLLRADEGRVEVLGADPARVGMPPGASFVAQDKPLYGTFRVREMLRAAAALNARGRWDAARAAGLVEAAGIGFDERVGALSPGGRARVALAIALGRDPELLLLDEPLAELDPLARRQVMGAVLAASAESGTTVVLSSHVIADVEDACDHLVLLGGGRVRLDGAVEDLLAQHRVITGATEPDGAVVHGSRFGRQVEALVRGTGDGEPPTLDDLVMGYLQAEDGRVAAAGAPS